MTRSILGLDIGGANLKACTPEGNAVLIPFALWRHPERLATTLRELFTMFAGVDSLAVTMTGELCDCFPTLREGVCFILEAVRSAAPLLPVLVWTIPHGFRPLDEMLRDPLPAAASNWHALATWCGSLASAGSALLLDIGSTTSDIIPLKNGIPGTSGLTDRARLRTRELVYTGVRRTPLCALLGAEGPAEWFATTLDVYLVLGDLNEDPTDHSTADGRPATRHHAHQRLARMLCSDLEETTERERVQLAQSLAQRQEAHLQTALAAVLARLEAPPQTIFLAGSGEFLARRMLPQHVPGSPPAIVSLTELLGPVVSHAACAHAVAQLAQPWGRTAHT